MKRAMIAVVLLMLAALPMARADEASKRAKVDELIAVMHMDRMMDQMTEALKTQTDQMLKQAPGMEALTPEKQKLVDDYEAQSAKIILDSVGWKALQPEFVAMYMKTFSEDEIDGIVAFYKSPAGQAMLIKMPQLMTASMEIAQRRMQEVEPQLQQLQEKFLKEMSDPPPAAPSSGPKS
jgi:hypothetical protein